MKKAPIALAGLIAAMMVMAGALADEPKSGLAVGDMTPAYSPQHVAGPDRGTQACPV